MTFELYYISLLYIHTWACTTAVGRSGPISNVHQVQNTIGFKHSMPSPTQPHHPPEWHVFHLIPAAEVTLSSLTLVSRTATTLSFTWSAGYPKCYSFTVPHSTQDGSVNVTQPADSDTSHTLISLQPGATYRIEVEAVWNGEGADWLRAKVMGYYTTNGPGT